jgi:hypothetical protein
VAFKARITNGASLLVSNYNITEHNTYKGLWHGQLNRVFMLAGMLCWPCPEPIVHKQKAAIPLLAAVPPTPETGKKWRRAKGSSHSGDQISAHELALAKALKPSKKFSLGSSGLSLTNKASAAKGGIHRGKTSLPRICLGLLHLLLKMRRPCLRVCPTESVLRNRL